MTLFGWRFGFVCHRNEVWFRAYRVRSPFMEPFGTFSVDGDRMVCAHPKHRWVGTVTEVAAVEQWKASNRARRESAQRE
jgi:hypothetical protein